MKHEGLTGAVLDFDRFDSDVFKLVQTVG